MSAVVSKAVKFFEMVLETVVPAIVDLGFRQIKSKRKHYLIGVVVRIHFLINFKAV